METVQIQAQDQSGNWRTYIITGNHSLQVLEGMRQLRWQFPDARIRAVDNSGRLVDML